MNNNKKYNFFVTNNPPSSPIIEGSIFCRSGNLYNYTFCSTDPESDNIYYLIHWGDGNVFYWTGPYKSGEKAVYSYCWFNDPLIGNELIIEAQAMDIHYAKSDWSSFNVVVSIYYKFIV